jgi:hypothetical protein
MSSKAKTKRGYKMKKVTKKEFRAAIKANDRTKVWHLCALKLGRTPTKSDVYDIISKDIIPYNFKKAFDFTYEDTERTRIRRELAFALWRKKGCYEQDDYKGEALGMLRRLWEEEITSYTKVPMFGFTRLYFCSPDYCHKDYNKVRTCEIKGNEEFCKKVVELGKRIYQKKIEAMKEAV